uniref:alpha amylase C-terminal domain-containing protein n=1 Tax=Paracoccus sp. TaxID=267 RepID=UPI0035AE9660
SDDGSPPVVILCNLTPQVHREYRIGLPRPGGWREVLNTDAADYGGSNVANPGLLRADETAWHGRPASLGLTLPPLATIVLVPE